jgi:putative transposase
MLYRQRCSLGFSWAALLEVADLSAQAFYASLAPSDRLIERTSQKDVLSLAWEVRKTFLPGASSREVYAFIRRTPHYDARLHGWGRDAFEAICLEKGLRIEIRGFVPKTTQRGDFMFENRISGLCIQDIDQLWVSDICYIYGTNGKLIGYATTLIDVYSRLLLGLAFSRTMHAAVTSHVVIQQAFQHRKKETFDKLIFHSDGGKQYIEKEFLNLIRGKNIMSSMAYSCYENPFAEAFNDILKNHMIPDLHLNSFAQLLKNRDFIHNCYNVHRPHGSLGKKRHTNLKICCSIYNLIKELKY